MVRSAAMALAGAIAFLPIACRQTTPSATPSDAPTLEVVAREEATFTKGTKTITWRLRGSGVKRLTARLTGFADGRPRGRTEIDCNWATPVAAMDGRLTLLVQDGRPFGAEGKLLSSLSLTFPAGRPTTRTEIRSEGATTDDVGGAQSLTAEPGPVQCRSELYVEVRGPLGEISGVRTDEELSKLSVGGRVASAVVLEWSPE
jgi:hypothetical protein